MSRPSLLQRTWIVYPKFQFEWMLYFSIGVGMLFLIVYMGASASFMGIDKICLDYAGENVETCRAAIADQRKMLNWAFILGGVMSVVFIFVGAAVVSNRVAGPLYRTISYLNSLERGGATQELGFRKDDHYAELAETLNRVIVKLRGY